MASPSPREGGFSFQEPIWLEETGSTNDALRQRLADGNDARAGLVLAARKQTRGKGRLGNTWTSIAGRDLTFSFLWEGPAGRSDQGTLPMACALGVKDFLAARFSLRPQCKWPNDVLAGGGKICGILAEAPPVMDGMGRLVVGIGVNVGKRGESGGGAEKPATSLEDLTGTPGLRPDVLLPLLLKHLEARIAAWTSGGFAAIREDLAACLWGIGRHAAVRSGGKILRGTMRGVGENGELMLLTDTMGLIPVSSVAALDFPPLG